MIARPRLLVVGETAVPTGYARIADTLLDRLQVAFDVHVFSVWGAPALPPRGWPTHVPAAGTPLVDQLAAALARVRPALVLILHDLRTVYALADVLRTYGDRLRTVSCFPLDTQNPKGALVRSLAVVDVVVAFTAAQAAAIRGAFGGGAEALRLEVIAQGVDTRRFRPLWTREAGDAKAALRRELFGERCAADAFVVLNANRNHLRKRIDLTVAAFARFARTRRDALLCLHAGEQDPMGWELTALARRHGVEDRLLLTASQRELPDAGDERLNQIYNACDVGLNTSVGEGWGLPAFEHAATGAAQVLPDHTACGELWRGHGVLVPATAPVPTVDPWRDEQRVDADDVADALAALYDDRAALRRHSRAAYEHATSERFSWTAIADRWRALLEELAQDG